MKPALVFLFLLVSVAARAQTAGLDRLPPTPLPADSFIAHVITAADSTRWMHLNGAMNAFFMVSAKDSQPEVRRLPERWEHPGLPVAGGTLVPRNMGEFGGGLLYFTDTGRKALIINGRKTLPADRFERSRYRIPPAPSGQQYFYVTHANPNYLFDWRGRHYMLEGLAHMGIKRGTLQQVDVRGDSLDTYLINSFDDAPQAVLVQPERLVIVTFEGLYVLPAGRGLQTVLRRAFWWGLYPSSVADIGHDTVAIGMRGGWATVRLTDGYTVFYEYKHHGLKPWDKQWQVRQ